MATKGLTMRIKSLVGNQEIVMSDQQMKAKASSRGFSPKKAKTACEKCRLHGQAQITDPINTQARVLVIGEAPGDEEERSGKLFVGRSGLVLRDTLDAAGIPPDTVQFANVCRCRPKGENGKNRTPTAAEITKCTETHLQHLIARHDKVIILGKVAESAVLGGSHEEAIGNVVAQKDKLIGVAYHPSYIYRQRQNAKVAQAYIQDFQFFRKVLFEDYTPVYTVVQDEFTRQSCYADLCAAEYIPIDYEATGVTVFDRLTILGLKGRDKVWVIPLIGKYADNWALAKRALRIEGKTYVAHNAQYEYKMSRANDLCERDILLSDVMIQQYALDPGRGRNGYRLKVICREHGLRWSRLVLTPWLVDDFDNLITYNAEDVWNTDSLYKIFRDETRRVGVHEVLAEVSDPALNVLGEMEYTGCRLDTELMTLEHKRLNSKMAILEDELTEIFGYKGTNKDGTKEEWNFGSDDQIGELLRSFGAEGLQITKTGKVSTSADNIEDLISFYENNPNKKNAGKILDLCRRRLQIQKIKKTDGTYIKGSFSRLGQDGRIRGGFHLNGTVTGRLSSSNPNLQNIPRGKSVKQFYVADPGWTFIEADASQAELRVGCSLAPDEYMISLYQIGADVHRYTAAAMTGKDPKDVTKSERQAGKPVNFGLLYGQSANGLREYAKSSYGVHLTEAQSRQFREAFFVRYPGFALWHNQVDATISLGNNTVRTPFGRVRYLDPMLPDHERVRQALNTPIQSAASDCTMLFARYIWDMVDPERCKFVLTVHDQVLLMVRDGYEQEVIRIVKASEKHVMRCTAHWLRVPFVIDMKLGKSWADMVELEF